jgi:hypothetical protein
MGMMVCAFHPRYKGSINRSITIQAIPGIFCKTLFKKISEAKRAWGMAQVIECLHSKHKALSSNPSSAKKTKTKTKHKKSHVNF